MFGVWGNTSGCCLGDYSKHIFLNCSMDRETNDIIARQYLSEKNLSQVEPPDYAKWADIQITRGRNFEHLRILRALSTREDASEAEKLFKKSLVDLGWEIPSRKSVMKRHAE